MIKKPNVSSAFFIEKYPNYKNFPKYDDIKFNQDILRVFILIIMSFTYVNPNSRNQESNQAYTDLCKLLNAVESIDGLNPNAFLNTYLHSSTNEQYELDQLESKLSKIHQKLYKVKDAITLRLLNQKKGDVTTNSFQTYTIREAAGKLKMSKSTLWRLVKKGLINCAWKNPERKRSPLFSEVHLNEFLNKN